MKKSGLSRFLCSDDPRGGQAARNNVPRRRAGSEISLFQPRLAEKRKSPLIRADFRQYFLHNPVQPQKISRPRSIFAPAGAK